MLGDNISTLEGDALANPETFKEMVNDFDFVDAWKSLIGNSKRTDLKTLRSKVEFDNIEAGWDKRMFNAESGGYVVAHPGHNDVPHEFTMGDDLANGGYKVKLLDEQGGSTGKKMPDADVNGTICDFKTFDSPSDVDGKVYNYIRNATSRNGAEGVVFNLRNNPATVEQLNNGLLHVLEDIKFNQQIPTGMAKTVGVIYPDGHVEFLSKAQILNGTTF